jgi:hypothetical protein
MCPKTFKCLMKDIERILSNKPDMQGYYVYKLRTILKGYDELIPDIQAKKFLISLLNNLKKNNAI